MESLPEKTTQTVQTAQCVWNTLAFSVDLPAKQRAVLCLTCFSVEIMAYRLSLSLTQSCFDRLDSFCVVIATGRTLPPWSKFPDIHLKKTSKQASTCSPYYNFWLYHLYQKYSCQKKNGLLLLNDNKGCWRSFFPFWKGSDFMWVLAMYTQSCVGVADVNFITDVSVSVILPKYTCLRFGFLKNFWCHLSDLLMSGHFSLPDYTLPNPPVPTEFLPKIHWILTVRMINTLKQTAEINSQGFYKGIR